MSELKNRDRINPAIAAGHRAVERASTTDGLPVSMSLGPVLDQARVPVRTPLVDRRVVVIACLAIALGIIAALVAEFLTRLILFITNVSFHGTFSSHDATPVNPHLGLWVVLIPVVGGIIVGIMARWGSAAIRGHGIPEAMEQVLTNQSRIPYRMTFLKPLSAAIAIGTGGPFGMEGPIIATGGAMGSLLGQIMPTSSAERKTLLAAGAAAGMAATFGSPVSAVLLAVELLLFEFRPRSIIPVALASAAAAAARHAFFGAEAPVFPMPNLLAAGGGAMVGYLVLGLLMGVVAAVVTRAVYAVEDAFEHIFEPMGIHWMWWPAIGGLAVGIVGYFSPLTLGVGYSNIVNIIGGHWTLGFVMLLCTMKFISWAIALGSGTSGGTLAPLFTIGGGVGMAIGWVLMKIFPFAHIDLRIAALVGMAAIFAGASRAMLASLVFAFETTWQPNGLLPLLAGCGGAFLVSCLTMPHSIMTLKIARRGVRVPVEYAADHLDQIPAREAFTPNPITLRQSQTLAEVRTWIASGVEGTAHQGYPVVDDAGALVGVLTRRDLIGSGEADGRVMGDLLRRPPVLLYDDSTVRDAVNHMVNHDVGRLPVLSRETRRVVGMVTRGDIIAAQRKRSLMETTPRDSTQTASGSEA
jgi:CIC family chloride channel protein